MDIHLGSFPSYKLWITPQKILNSEKRTKTFARSNSSPPLQGLFSLLLKSKNLWSLKHSPRRETSTISQFRVAPLPNWRACLAFALPLQRGWSELPWLSAPRRCSRTTPTANVRRSAWWVIGRIVKEPLGLHYDNRSPLTVSSFSARGTLLFVYLREWSWVVEWVPAGWWVSPESSDDQARISIKFWGNGQRLPGGHS